MKKKQQNIPRFNLSASAKGGIFIQDMEASRLLAESHDLHKPHRDHHHLLFLLKSGYVELMVDFKPVQVQGPAVGMIFPDQVHYLTEYASMVGYSLAFDPVILSAPLQRTLQQPDARTPMWNTDPVLLQQVFTLGDLLHQLKQAPAQAFTNQAMQGALHAMLCLLGNAAMTGTTVQNTESRGQQITHEFQRLLREHFKEWKRPSVYAEALSITTSHLNDVVREATGASVSQHLQEAVILEAKRLLSHTDKTVKEITYEIGLEDHGYFSRLFKKVTSQTPLQFRQQFRD